MITLGACGGLSSNSETTPLVAEDLKVAVKCADWERFFLGQFRGECQVTVKNQNSSEGRIVLGWRWEAGTQDCGAGFVQNAFDEPVALAIEPNDEGTWTTPAVASFCNFAPTPGDVEVTVLKDE